MKIKRNEVYLWLLVFATCFIAYQLVQDYIRPQYAGNSAIITYLLGVAPNFFPAIGIPALFVVLMPHLTPSDRNKWLMEKRNITANVVSLIGLLSWEFTQTITTRGRFDWNDVAWTIIGAIVFHGLWILVRKRTAEIPNNTEVK